VTSILISDTNKFHMVHECRQILIIAPRLGSIIFFLLSSTLIVKCKITLDTKMISMEQKELVTKMVKIQCFLLFTQFIQIKAELKMTEAKEGKKYKRSF